MEQRDSTLYLGGTVRPMGGQCAQEALWVEHGRVRAVGTEAELRRMAPHADLFDLAGHTLLPAFMDSHSHITSLAATLGLAQLSGTRSLDEMAARIRAFAATGPQDGWITGFGYDHNTLAEHRHPDKTFLDSICPDRPLLVTHASGHMGVCNSAALRLLGISAHTPDPAGGRIGRVAGSREPNGYLEETAFTGVGAKIPAPDEKQRLALLDRAQKIYLSHGVTTVQDGLTRSAEWGLLTAAAEGGRLKVDVVAYPDLVQNEALTRAEPYCRGYAGRLRVGGGKIFLDGSPQGRTAWLSAPYLGDETGYCGYPVHTDEETDRLVLAAYAAGVQVLAHCNGDAAADQFLAACEKAQRQTGRTGLRPVMIHAQLVRKDQLARMAALSMVASFFVAHTRYWGDVHLANLGRARADFISPVQSAMKAGVVCTFHQDSPVLPPNMLDTIACAMQRRTLSGVLLAESERVSAGQALAAVTQNVAYQYFEETSKGTLAPGKVADLVILERDPMTCPPEEIAAIGVLATVKDGRMLYSR